METKDFISKIQNIIGVSDIEIVNKVRNIMAAVMAPGSLVAPQINYSGLPENKAVVMRALAAMH